MYDSNGRRPTSITTNNRGTIDVTGDAANATPRVGYTYTPDRVNRSSVNDNGSITNYAVSALNQYVSTNGETIYHDANFNVSMHGGWFYYYDAQNRLMTIRDWTGALLVANTYDGLGRCLKRDRHDWGTFVELIAYDGWKPIVEWDGAGNWQAWNVYGPGPDEILWRYEPANTKGHLRYHHDVHGNVTALLTYAGEVLEKYTYDTFGRPTVTDANGTNPRTGSNWRNRFMFTAREYYPHLWLYDYRNRWYDPQLGRFLQTDPTGFDAGDMNLFRYCADDPVDRSDPTGLVDTSAASEIWQRQAAFDTASSSHSGLEQLEKQWQDRVAAARRQDMASHSEASIASTKYHNTRFGSVNHCNEFVGDMAEAAGRVRPMVWVEGFPGGFWRPAVSHELADRNVKIPGWTFPKPLSEARRNDIIAQQHGKGGHTGVVVGPGRSISVNSLEGGVVRAGEWGFRPYPGNGERKGDPPPVVRHYIAGSSAEW